MIPVIAVVAVVVAAAVVVTVVVVPLLVPVVLVLGTLVISLMVDDVEDVLAMRDVNVSVVGVVGTETRTTLEPVKQSSS